MIKAKLVELHGMRNEFEFAMDEEDVRDLYDTWSNGLLVELIDEETDGYWNIKLPSGRVVTGISEFHLENLRFA